MAKIPKSPEDIFDEFTRDYQTVFGEDLVSVYLYGSGAKGEYVRKKSDINFLIVLSEEGISDLAKAFGPVKKWQKRAVSVPLFLTEKYIRSSLDSFPIEFLNIKRYNKLVYGQEILASIEIKKNDLRLRCEEQVKGKLLHLREGFLKTLGGKRALEHLLAVTVPAFASLFAALLTLKDIDAPENKNEILARTADVFQLEVSVFQQVLRVREKSVKLNKNDLIALTESYISEIRKLAIQVDQM
ncbi:hypothetical protein A2V82_07220 [candidate division KSB1 bacterium RBG_16_48_16]|nr:MAG: hypothetical protein A2V82_07220 [candidate division KSB1 bacterium RBG_16_48_16]